MEVKTACATALLIAAAVTTTSATAQSPAASKSQTGNKPPTILFMCPHGAAKSVLASAYFEQWAKERGLNVRVITAGTDPDPQVAPRVERHLRSEGYKVPVTKPRRVTDDDLKNADVVVSLGCDLKDLPQPAGRLVKWDDVPAPSEDFAAADAKIRQHVMELINEFLKKQGR
jgi:arsenate reductase (thioredoxin)